MIRGMVANLAAKQEADPGNLDGWLRLGQAYAVLHEPDKAADAYRQGRKLRPDDVSIPLQEVRALLSDQAPAEKLPPRVIGLLKHVEATDPDQPLVLWYLGVAAAQDARVRRGTRYWSRLLAKLPPGGEDARMIQSALDTLSKTLDLGEVAASPSFCWHLRSIVTGGFPRPVAVQAAERVSSGTLRMSGPWPTPAWPISVAAAWK